ncbi:src-like-adapter 2 isoform X8 [Cuculus canorus]|uniref:src-like-adapter 2 isoform X8 n=1 Tax=Cuculus canorus TaxID=55661 RepID=UPI0023AB3F44|nr:src-like-adapter 2 isoform X8 [Cuculus canorus]
MGSLPSQEKPPSVPPVAAHAMEPPPPSPAGKRRAAAPPWAGVVLGTPEPQTFPTEPSTFLALCDFPSGAGSTAALRMGEQLRVLSEDGEWWLVHSQVSGKECQVPSSCVAKVRHRWLYEGVSRQKAEELLLRPGNRSGSFLIRESQTRRGCFSLSVRHSTRSSWDSVTHYRIHRLENGWLYISPRLTFPSLRDLVEHYSGNAATPRAPVCVWGALCPAGSGRGGGGWSPPPRCPRGWGAQGTLLTVPAARPEFGEGLCCTLREPCSVEGARVATAPALPTVVKKPPLSWDKIDSSMLLSEAASLPEEDSPISLGLREAISSYLLLTDAPEQSPTGKGAKSS